MVQGHVLVLVSPYKLIQLIVSRFMFLVVSNLLRLIKHFIHNKLGFLDSVSPDAVISLTSKSSYM